MLTTITIDGEEFTVDDFAGSELLDAERAFNVNLLAGIDQPTMAVLYAIVWLVKRRRNPGYTPAEAMNLKLGDLSKMMGDGDEGEGKQDPPPARAKAGAKKQPA
jgi:hypothetical protein